jgi:hypothetical protein
MVFEQGLAEPFHPDEFAIILCRVSHLSGPPFKCIKNIIPNKFSVSREFLPLSLALSHWGERGLI